jgi:hypothetical protein
MVDQGLRRPGTGKGNGFLNDQYSHYSLFGWLGKGKYYGCKDQAYNAKDCFANADAIKPFDAKWGWNVVPWWFGSHYVVRLQSSDPNDPLVYCDPWRDFVWTAPNVPNGGGGGGAF